MSTRTILVTGAGAGRGIGRAIAVRLALSGWRDVMRRVIHDFDDERAAAILSNVRRHMARGSTLLLLEGVVPPCNTPHFAKTLDLNMMNFVGRREQTERQFGTLLDRAGFRITRVVPTVSTTSLNEAVAGR